MKKVIISIFIILFLFLGISYFYYVHNSNARKYINNWNIELSSNLKSLYEKKTEIGFQGDGTIYEIFELQTICLLTKILILKHYLRNT